MSAQNLLRPTPLFTAPCASSSFNTFSVEFEWNGALVGSSNAFILELSDANGDFTSPVQLASVTDRNTTFRFNFDFSFPTSIGGENYKVRVRSTNPALTSPESVAFPAYYQNVTQGLILNGFAGTIAACNGGSVTLSIDNFPGEPRYRWFKNRNFTPIPGETGPTLTVTQAGFYFVEVDYGDFCSASTASNEIEVVLSPPQGIAINGPANIEICPGTPHHLTANIDDTNLVYRWFKDGNLINTPPGYLPSITLDPANPAGIYTLEIENSGGCRETSAPVTVTTPDFNVSTNLNGNVVLLPGEDIELEVTTDAVSPDFRWFRNGSIISGETSATLSVNSPGTYHATVTQNAGCSFDIVSSDIIIELPQSIDITIGARAPYTACDNTEAVLEVTQITAVISGGTIIDVRPQLLNRFNYQWFNGTNPISGETSESLTLSDAALNGTYHINADLNSFNINSNDFDLQLRIDENATIVSDGTISCDGATNITINSNITDPSYTYTWFRDNTEIPAETNPTLSINLTGAYRLRVTAFGCDILSNEIIISPFDDSLVTVDAPETIVITEGSFRIVTASGADSYVWFNEENIQISNNASVTLSEEGQYVLRASVGTCEVIKRFTVQFQENFAVPNVISPNADGINDLWVIPNRFAFNPEVEIIIVGSSGEDIFRTTAYQNNWPESNFSFSSRNPVVYYRIVRGAEILKQGTITLIR